MWRGKDWRKPASTAAGQIYCWGRGVNGLLGNGGTADSLVPVPVSGARTYTSLTLGTTHTCALDPAGTAWCWGGDDFGQLGVDWSTSCPGVSGVSHCSLQPVAVPNLRFKQIAAGTAHICGISTADELWCWGDNAYGQLGLGYTSPCIPSTIRPFKVVTR